MRRFLSFFWARFLPRGTREKSQRVDMPLSREPIEELPSSEKEEFEVPASDEISIIRVRGQHILKAGCGHSSKEQILINCFGTLICAPGNEKCADCVLVEAKELIARCCSCGSPILPNHSICLFRTDAKLPSSEAGTRLEGKQVVCSAMDCCPSGGMLIGHWVGHGKKPQALILNG